jgi:hypothetical protein
MKKAKLSTPPKLSFVVTTFLCYNHGIGSTIHHISFEKHDKVHGKERGFEDGAIFKFPRSFDLFIKGARETDKNFTKKIWLFTEP